METLEAIFNRRSIRDFTDEPVVQGFLILKGFIVRT